MRIISGKWRGKQLVQPPQNVTRPTTDRVREALFSILLSRIGSFDGVRVLDAFAGSGALGLESLSRGASHVVFAEKDVKVRRILLQNISAFSKACSIAVVSDVFELPPAEHPCHLIFLDPPYGAGLEFEIVPILMTRGYINELTIVVLETRSVDVPTEFAPLALMDSRCYGSCALTFWQYHN